MAKVTITFEDLPDGTVNCRADFDPPTSPKPTGAQEVAEFALRAAMLFGGASPEDARVETDA